MGDCPEHELIQAFTLTPGSLRRLREAYGMTLPEFARFIGVTAATLASWESGASRPQGRLEARALDHVVDEAQGRFPGLQLELEPNPEAAGRQALRS